MNNHDEQFLDVLAKSKCKTHGVVYDVYRSKGKYWMCKICQKERIRKDAQEKKDYYNAYHRKLRKLRKTKSAV